MDKLKQWIALTVLGVFAVLAAGWFLLVAPKNSEAADLDTQAAAQVSANSILVTQLAYLKSQSKDLPKQQARLAAIAAKIPDNPALPALLRALSTAAAAAGVELVSISPAAPAAFTGALAVGVTVPVAATPNTTAAASPAALQSIGLTINVVGGYFQVEQFLDGVEGLSRSLKVTGFTLAPGLNPVKAVVPAAAGGTTVESGKSLTAVITGQVYMTSPATTAAVTVPVAAGAVTAK